MKHYHFLRSILLGTAAIAVSSSSSLSSSSTMIMTTLSFESNDVADADDVDDDTSDDVARDNNNVVMTNTPVSPRNTYGSLLSLDSTTTTVMTQQLQQQQQRHDLLTFQYEEYFSSKVLSSLQRETSSQRLLFESNDNQAALKYCSDFTSNMVTCLLMQCLGRPCADGTENGDTTIEENEEDSSSNNSNAVKDCDILEAQVCGALDLSCCPPCAESTTALLDCLLDFTVGSHCPGATCSTTADNDGEAAAADIVGEESENNEQGLIVNMTTAATTTAPFLLLTTVPPLQDENSNDNSDNTTTEGLLGNPTNSSSSASAVPPSASTLAFPEQLNEDEDQSESCSSVVQNTVECIVLKCAFRNCNSNPGGSGPGTQIEDCSTVTEESCRTFHDAMECCPECRDETTKYLDCFIDTLSQVCPGVSCTSDDDDDHDTKSKSFLPSNTVEKQGAQEEGTIMRSTSISSSAATTTPVFDIEESPSFSISGSPPALFSNFGPMFVMLIMSVATTSIVVPFLV